MQEGLHKRAATDCAEVMWINCYYRDRDRYVTGFFVEANVAIIFHE